MSGREAALVHPPDADAGDRAWDDACAVARLLAVDPAGLGGVWLRARTGPARDRWLARLRGSLPGSAPVKRLPLHISDGALLGGLDLAATLKAGRPMAERGLLAAADGGVLVLVSAERCSAALAARLAAVLDTGEVAVQRDGFAWRQPTKVAVVALDEGIEPDERPPPALVDRMAFRLDLDALPTLGPPEPPAAAEPERIALCVRMPDDAVEALCGAAQAFGIDSLRAQLLAVRAAAAAAAADGRAAVAPEDVTLAARLVLAPRATRLPPDEAPSAPAPAKPPPEGERDQDEEREATTPPVLADVVLAAVAAALPAGLLARLQFESAGRRSSPGSDGAGAQQRDHRRGRPAGAIKGEPGRGARLNLVETLRAAAPWQRIRRREQPGSRLAVRRDDLRVTRFKRSRETTTVFVVDASGSSAFHRLAEAKGAVELLLADCYVRRDRVALISFRGEGASLLLPPTRSLARAKRSLAGLVGGGGTPLATAIDEAGTLAAAIARAGGSAVLVFLTDGRGNIARDGQPGRERAARDAASAAGRLAAGSATVLFIDTSPRPSPAAAELAGVMAARYIPLPSADAKTLSGYARRAIDAARPGSVA